MKPRIHLLCNAHLDPVWLWEWQEGAAEVMSTFRTAADLCEEFDGFIFNHNEAILYRWVEEYEPELFKRIQRLVREGKWRIMGGWYLQPDCNMPSGESFTRQALVGKRYFREKFGVEPTTAINFDPFGHTRGLVQIIAKSGSDSYICMRPGQRDCPLPANDFIWIGYDGSEIVTHRITTGYNSQLGKAREKVEGWIRTRQDREVSLVPWGVGNHGGGPSRADLRELADLIREQDDADIRHSSAEAYFDDLRKAGTLPTHAGDLNSWAPGCYTSQIRIKQAHRALENELYRAEKMASHVSMTTGAAYPKTEIDEALRDLLTSEFHDILPGSSIRPAEESALRLLSHGREIVSRVTARSFFSLCAGQKRAEPGTYPVFVYNPHPFPVRGVFSCEFNLADQNWTQTWTVFDLFADGRKVPVQVERELSNIYLDWRKRVVFEAELEPSSLNRFDAVPVCLEKRPASPRIRSEGAAGYTVTENGRVVEFRTDRMRLGIDRTTGFIDSYEVDGALVIDRGGMRPIVITDYEDPWGSTVQEFRRLEGSFALLDAGAAARFAGIDDRSLDPVRIVEEGDTRTVVEASLGYNDSRLLITYSIPKRGAAFDVEIDVLWQEKGRMLKLAVPTPFVHPTLYGQVAFGVESLPTSGKELVSQKWQCLSADAVDAGDGVSETTGTAALLCINDGIYGSDCKHGELRLSLLRSAAYSALAEVGARPAVASDRHTSRIDQGSRQYRFRFEGGDASVMLSGADRAALAFNEQPYVLSFYPSGDGERPGRGLEIDGASVVCTAFKLAEDESCRVLRLFNPTRSAASATVRIPALDIVQNLRFGPCEVKTYRLTTRDGVSHMKEANLLEAEL